MDEGADLPDELTLRDYVRIVRRRRFVALITAVVVAAGVIGLSFSWPDEYAAESRVIVRAPVTASDVSAKDRPVSLRLLESEALRANGTELLQQVRDVVGDEPELSASLTVGADILVFRATADDPDRAIAAATAYAETYMASRDALLAADLEARAAVAQTRLDEIATELESATSAERTRLANEEATLSADLRSVARGLELADGTGAALIDTVVVSTSSMPDGLVAIALACASALFAGLAVAFAVEYFDRSPHDEVVLAAATGLPVVAVVPTWPDAIGPGTGFVTTLAPHSRSAEAYRSVRAAINTARADRAIRILQFTSAAPGEGTSSTAANVAIACARAGQRVLVVDCDLRHPGMHTLFGLSNDRGFSTAMIGGTIDEVVQKVDGEPNLTVITSGPTPPDPAELLASRPATEFVRGLPDVADLVVVDSPPVLSVSDPLVVGSVADGSIIVANARTGHVHDVGDAADQLAQFGAYVIGAVLNDFDERRNGRARFPYAETADDSNS